MTRKLQPVLMAGIIDGLLGLESGEEFRIIPFGLVKKNIMEQSFADWLFENEPLTDRVVVVLAVDGNQIVRHRAAFEIEFGEAVDGKSDLADSLADLKPRRHPNA